jgi:hypothetical protein
LHNGGQKEVKTISVNEWIKKGSKRHSKEKDIQMKTDRINVNNDEVATLPGKKIIHVEFFTM